MRTITLLLPYLQFLAGSGSGWLASWLFDRLRDDILPLPTYPAWAAHLLDVAVYRPMGARITAFVLTASIAAWACVGVALITGHPVLDTVYLIVASLLAIVLGQVRHGVRTFAPLVDVELEGDSDARDSNP